MGGMGVQVAPSVGMTLQGQLSWGDDGIATRKSRKFCAAESKYSVSGRLRLFLVF